MSELRLNLVTREWVIIATERLKRPAEFRRSEDRPAILPFNGACPFCPGNEFKTAKELFRIEEGGKWKVRVVSNRYPAVAREGERKRTTDRTKRMVAGVGLHEIIIESPRHDAHTAAMDPGRVEDIIRIYRDRFTEAHRDPRVEHVIIFKNRGEAAGTTIEQPITQMIAAPVVPLRFRDRVQAAMHYFDDTGECMMCDILRMEMTEGARVIMDTEHFLTFIPYAALSPFHTWIFPKRHSASFADIRDEEIKEAALHLRTVLSKLSTGLEDPDYNYSIRSSRPQDTGNPYSHWYLSLVPRVAKAAGFELGSGMFMNAGLPEEMAAYLKSIRA
ncbi:MAG: galactose-1-phosphate uridylyltransferase [Deltaproteobacteria bacterium]|nr:galactose-1-phosphate uridylyltransferase [Deltaproteobacteria bacterium]